MEQHKQRIKTLQQQLKSREGKPFVLAAGSSNITRPAKYKKRAASLDFWKRCHANEYWMNIAEKVL